MDGEIIYEAVSAFSVGCYQYIDGQPQESFYVDSQNCDYHTYNNKNYDKETGLINGKNWWIICPHMPKGTEPSENNKHLLKWYVSDSSKDEDLDKEWNFNEHSVKH